MGRLEIDYWKKSVQLNFNQSIIMTSFVVLIITLSALIIIPPSCRSYKIIKVGEKTLYHVEELELNFFEAFAHCKALNMELLSFTDWFDMRNHQDATEYIGVLWTAARLIKYDGEEQYWVFLTTGEMITGTPLESNIMAATASYQCAAFFDLNFHQFDCSIELSFVCQNPIDSDNHMCQLNTIEPYLTCKSYIHCDDGEVKTIINIK